VKRDLALGALLVAVLVAVALLSAKPPEGPKAATRGSNDFSFGGYRAWYSLLAREGVRVSRFRQYHDALADDRIDTLVVAFPEKGVGYEWSAGELDALRAWVRKGGRLIDIGIWPPVSSDKNEGKNDPVYGVDTKGDGGRLRGPWSNAVRSLTERGNERIAAREKAHAQTLLADRAGGLVVRYPLGRGEVIAIANAAPFENRALDRGDNARLAYLAAVPRNPRGVVAFDEAVRGDIVARAWYLALDVPERVALAFVALAGVLWLLYGILPLGPPVRLRAAREPTSEEFVDAFAALYGRAHARDHARDALIADARHALERAPRTRENATLAERVRFAQTVPLGDDAALIDIARLSRLAREETVRATSPDRRSTAPAGGARTRRRRR
jgi:Domain of unknown function (DUF4350)